MAAAKEIKMNDKPTYEELTAIVQANEKLAGELQQIFDLSPDMIGSANLEGYFEKINDSFEKILGYTPEEFCSKPFLHFVHEDDLERTKSALLSASAGKKLIEIENRYRCKNGEIRWIDWKVWDTGNGEKYIAVGRDITDRKQMRQSLQASEHRYETVTKAAQDFIFIKNDKRQYTFVNPAMAKLFGLNEAEIIGKTPEQLFNPEFAEVVKEVDDKTFNGEEVNEIRTLKMGANEYVFHTVQVPLERQNGKVTVISGIVRDITEVTRVQKQKEELEAQRLQIQKLEAIGTLAGGIAHDFNNMLGVIIGNTSLARDKLDKMDPLYEILTGIQTGALQAQGLTQQLLTFARGGEPVKQSTDLNQLIKETARFVTSGSGSTCVFELARDLWPADIDPGQINQAIGNLVLNACQAMPESGTIKIRTANIRIVANAGLPLPDGRFIKIEIEDKGVGILEKHLSKIFDPYFTTKQQGSGLGLASTFSIIKRHGGHINARSKVNEGTVMTLFLPACDETSQNTCNENTAHQGTGKVLVMDDHEQILKISTTILEQMGYETMAVKDGTEAIEQYRQAHRSGEPFDLVILDLTVPGGLGGARVIPELLKIDPAVKAIVSSGYSNDPILANYKDYGFSGVLPKPFTTGQVAAVLNKVFNRGSGSE